METPWPEVKSNRRSKQQKLQPWCSTIQRLEAVGSSAQQNKMELKPGR